MSRSAARLALVAALAALLGAAPAAAHHRAGAPEPEPRTPIRHFVTLMQENHSFDNYFGTYPGADGIPRGVCMPIDNAVKGGKCIRPFRIGNSAIEDLSHSQRTHRRQLNGGKMDGFVSAIAQTRGRLQPLVMGHYDDRDIPFYWNVADEYVLFDRFFTSAAGGSVTNHMYWVSGGPGNEKGDTIPKGGFDDPTIFDRLEAKGISWKFYIQNYDPNITFRSRGLGDRGSQIIWAPLLNYARFVDDPELFAHIVPFEEFFEDLRRGTLPAVSYVVPSGSSEHPPGSITAGETFVRTLINGLMRSRLWSSSALHWTYDDWGGWYDHVRPPRVDRFGYGFRAPALLVSAYARRGHIEHSTMDFTSILKFIEENWGLAPLARRDRRANSLMPAFDFSRPPRSAAFLSRERNVRPLPEPRRSAVYLSYSAALGLALLVVVFAALWEWRRRRRTRRALAAVPVLLLGAVALPGAIAPAPAEAAARRIVVQTVPPLAGVRVRGGERTYATDARGRLTMRVRPFPGGRTSADGFPFATPHVLDTRLPGGTVARLARWSWGVRPGHLLLGLSMHYPVSLRFSDARGAPVDPARIQGLVLKSNLGRRELGRGTSSVELEGTRLDVVSRGRLESKAVGYSVESVTVDGANLVHRGEVRFHPFRTRVVPIPLLFFDVTIAARDALFGDAVGSAVELLAPDGRKHRHELDARGEVALRRLPRGRYKLRVLAPGIERTRVLTLSRNQFVEVRVMTYPDMLIAGSGLAGLAAGLVLVRRPLLRARLRARARLPRPSRA